MAIFNLWCPKCEKDTRQTVTENIGHIYSVCDNCRSILEFNPHVYSEYRRLGQHRV